MKDRDRSVPAKLPISETPHLRFLRTVREHELDRALAFFPSSRECGIPQTVLEIGAGTGQQARSLSDKGYRVVAIDLASSHYRNDRVFDVKEYDGRNIPMPARSVDIVFSSNVLEHVHEIDAFLEETRRVMTEDGISIHILPSSACRLWGIPAHYIWLAQRIFARLVSAREHDIPASAHIAVPRTPQSMREWLGTLFPMRHGERGVTLTEAYYYSQHWWCRKFRENEFEIVRVSGNGLFYTMANALTDSLDLKKRRLLSRVLGDACHIYVLKRSEKHRKAQHSTI